MSDVELNSGVNSPKNTLMTNEPNSPILTSPSAPPAIDTLARKMRRQQEREAKDRLKRATSLDSSRKRSRIFQKAFARWLSTLSPEDAAYMLKNATTAGLTNSSKKAMFLALYHEMWPNRIECLDACGVTYSWLKDQLRKDPDFAAEVLALEFRRLDTLKSFSYEQCFHPQNTAERLFWLKTVGRDEFGEEPLIQMTQNILQTQEGFSKVETLLKRRQALLDQKESLLARTRVDAQPQGPGPGTPEP